MKEISKNVNEKEINDNINKIVNENNILINEDNSVNQSNSSIMDENYLNTFSQLPLLDIDFEKLNDFQIHIIKSIFEDIVYKVYSIELKREGINRSNSENKINLSLNSIENNEFFIEKDIFDTLKKNIDNIFKFKNTKIFQEIFSSDTEICAELFYLKWRFGLKEGGDNYAENAIKKYHKYLLKNHPNPFIFKFYLFISNKNLFPLVNIDAETLKQKTNKIKLTLLNFILDTLNDCSKESKTKKESNSFYINNLLNLLFILNDELSNEDPFLFNSNSFCGMFFKYISLLDKTCLLYSNYYMEVDEECGKIVSEVIYDLFFAISVNSFNEKEFMKAFTKENRKEKEIFTIFYLIDIFKEDILCKEKKINEELKKYIHDLDFLKSIHINYFSKRKNKTNIKLFLDKHLYKIEDVNFSIYFLAKSYLYLKKKKLNERFKSFLKEIFLPLLSKNIFRLYTKRSNFYGNKMCQQFPLYSLTKTFIETFIISNPNKLDSYNTFFFTDIPIKLKEEFNISYCYSSRLLDDVKASIKFQKKEVNSLMDNELMKNNENDNNITNNGSESSNEIIRSSTKDVSIQLLQNIDFDNNSSTFIIEYEEDENMDYSKIENEEKDKLNSFELIKKDSIIFQPKNYFFKIIFAEIYKNIVFNDNIFKLIKLSYLLKYRKKNINKDSKQFNYPVKQKNFSNSLEAKIFIRKNFNFYNENFLKISHSYLNINLVNKYSENIILHPHNFKTREQQVNYKKNKKEATKSLDCELVTNQYIYFGKMYFYDKYIFFESEEDPRVKNNFKENINLNNKSEEHQKDNNEPEEYKDLEKSPKVINFLKYAISNWTKEELASKEKSILIYNEDIKEIIQRRTLFIYQAVEIFHKNGKSYFFNFFKTENAEKAYNIFNEINKNLFEKFIYSNNNNNEEEIKKLLNLFHKGKISNYEYILKLNKYSTRTYNDINQYPVFPWLLKKYDKISDILSFLENKEINEDSNYFRDLKYPMLAQNEFGKNKAKEMFCDNEDYDIFINDEKKKIKFHSHYFTHYSSSAFIIHYLLRINPFEQNMIKLQDDKFDHPDRFFNGFPEIEEDAKDGKGDNREAIPDYFSYFDYFCNLNCCFFGIKSDKSIIDDIKFLNIKSSSNTNIVSFYAYLLYANKKILNDVYISKRLSQWVDIIFGKKQYPEKIEERYKSLNIYSKVSYEQKSNIENKIMKYKEKFKTEEKRFMIKVKDKIESIVSMGMNVKKILNDTVSYEGKIKTLENIYKENKTNNDEYIYFNKLKNDNFILLKVDKKSKNGTKQFIIYDKNFKENECKIYDCKSLYSMKNKNKYKNEDNFELYKVCYAFSYLDIIVEKTILPIILSCRYLDNFFRIQYYNKIINVFYEDLVTCIKERNLSLNDDVFYTGLLNGKLTEWRIIPFIVENKNKNKNKKKIIEYNFKLNELRHIYAHKSSITAIELYHNQNIIITSGEDKFIYIRKLFDFELLTAINLIYSFGNPIISETCNIFPSLIKISELNLLYVLLYDYDSKKTIIRGYNLNGLFFAQTDKNKNLQFNNISFTKYSNLVVGFYNSNEIQVLSASNLESLWSRNDDNKNKGTKMVEYDYNTGEFYILYDNEFIVTTKIENDEKGKFESF